LTLTEFQSLIAQMYSSKDEARGIDGTFMWLMEEVGELAAALREGTPEQQSAEFADVLAWLPRLRSNGVHLWRNEAVTQPDEEVSTPNQ
jgi:hypothetical protein